MAEFKVRAFLRVGDEIVPVEDLTPEEWAAAKERMLNNLSRVMSEYYSNHLDEYAKLCAGDDGSAKR